MALSGELVLDESVDLCVGDGDDDDDSLLSHDFPYILLSSGFSD